MEDGVDGEAGGRVYLQLGGYVAAMGGDGVYRQEQPVGYLLVGKAFGYKADDLLLAVADQVALLVR